jgi:hypothetical protein
MADPATEEQLLVVNCLMYAFSRDEKPGTGESIYDWAKRLAEDEARLDAVAGAERGMITSDEFKLLVNTVVSNPGVYGQMNVKDVKVIPGSPDAGPEGADDWDPDLRRVRGHRPVVGRPCQLGA